MRKIHRGPGASVVMLLTLLEQKMKTSPTLKPAACQIQTHTKLWGLRQVQGFPTREAPHHAGVLDCFERPSSTSSDALIVNYKLIENMSKCTGLGNISGENS